MTYAGKYKYFGILVFWWWKKREGVMADAAGEINRGQPQRALGAIGAKVSPRREPTV